ncbi:MAG: glycosyltransferase family 39 protein [Chloroflexi bacterium]|nr:glycosyltransferase family 39 protein [Chloroflexota bacterium]
MSETTLSRQPTLGAPARSRALSLPLSIPFSESTAIFGLGLALNLAMAWFVVYQLNIFVTDAMSRTLAAQRVFFGADPKLTEVGFIWAPLPTLLQIPLVLIPPLRQDGLSGNVLTAIMGAITLVSLNRIYRHLRLGRGVRYALLLLCALNPMTLYYSSNGLSEMTFVCFTILSIDYLLEWANTYNIRPLISMGFAVGIALLARYDTAIHAWLLLAVIYFLLTRRSTRPSETQAMLVTYFAPVCFFGGLWVLFNLMIMGDPIYFVRGAYSNAAQIGFQLAVLGEIAKLTGNPVGIARFITEQVTLLFPMFSIGVVLLLLDFGRTRNRLSLSVALLAMSFPAFQALNFFSGQSAAFIRYFILAVPYGYLMAGQLIGRVTNKQARYGVIGLALTGLLLSNFATAYAMSTVTERTADWGQWNDTFIRAGLTGERVNTWPEEREIAAFLNRNVSGRGVLVDSFQGYRVVFFTGNPKMWVVNGDRDFEETLKNPIGKVRYILVASPQLEGALNRVNQVYPSLYEYGASWATLVGEWPILKWKLYEVRSS